MALSDKNRKKIHAIKRELGLTDEIYRDILRNETGKDSSTKLTDRQAERVFRRFEALGWKPKRQGSLPGVTIPRDPQSRKIQALWITLYQKGVVRNCSDLALLKMVRTVTRVDRLEWCDSAQKSAVIEALKSMAKREGVDVG